jgi:hypothetical protein
MIHSGNHIFIPHKPHPFGILLWGGATRASLSGLCFLFFWIPRYDDTKPTPTEAMRRIVRVAASWAQKHAASIRVISDAAFRSSEMIPMCLGLGIDVTASLSDNNKGPLPHIYDLVRLDIANGHCRTILFAAWHYRALTAALLVDPQAVDVIPMRISQKRVLIAMLVRAVHEKMRLRPDLVCKAWAKSTLLVAQTEPEDVAFDQESIDPLIVAAIEDMMRTTLNETETGDANQEEVEILVQEAPDDDIPVVDLAEYDEKSSQQQDNDEEVLEEEEFEDDDFIQVDEVDERTTRRRIRRETVPYDDNISVESSQRVSLQRGPRVGLIEGKYRTSHRPSPSQLVDLILQSRPDIKRSVVMSAIQQTHDEFSFVLEKPDRGLFHMGASTNGLTNTISNKPILRNLIYLFKPV